MQHLRGTFMYLKYILSVFVILMFLGKTGLHAQSQLGNDMNGEASGDLSGRSVSLSADGSRVAIGAPNNDGTIEDSGHVRVYDWNGNTWVQVGADIDGEGIYDYSGFSVSVSADGSRVAIGASKNDGNGNRSGNVRVFHWDGNGWLQLGAAINGEAASDQSGFSVSLSASGTRVAIGAALNDGNGGESGHVRVYDFVGSTWVQTGEDINGEAASDLSGISVSLSANGLRVVIGAIDNDGNGTDSGHVRIYNWNGSSWLQVGADIDGEAAGDNSGYAVSSSDDGMRLAIGAPTNDGNGIDSGHVRVYDWNGSTWVQVGADIDGEADGDESGSSVSINADGTRVAIGSRLNNDNGTYSGHVRVYDWLGSEWMQVGGDIDGDAQYDSFGESVSLNTDGTILAIGAPFNDNNTFNSGHVRVFNPDGLLTIDGQTDLTNANIVIYSNPAKNTVSLSNPKSITLEEAKVYDMSGRLVRTFNLRDMGTSKAFDISTLAAATYTIIITGQGGMITKKLMKR